MYKSDKVARQTFKSGQGFVRPFDKRTLVESGDITNYTMCLLFFFFTILFYFFGSDIFKRFTANVITGKKVFDISKVKIITDYVNLIIIVHVMEYC